MTDTASGGRVVLYADYVCPFCRLGYATLRRYLDERSARGMPPLSVEWRPFDLRADERGPDGTIPRAAAEGKEEYVRARWGEVETLAAEYGVEMRMDVETYLDVDARTAQLVALGLKRDVGDGDRLGAFHDAVFDALWVGTRDVGDPAVLRELVAGVGVDPDRVTAWLEDGALAERFAAAADAALEAGVGGVPTVSYDGRTAYGSRSVAGYREFFEGDGAGPDVDTDGRRDPV